MSWRERVSALLREEDHTQPQPLHYTDDTGLSSNPDPARDRPQEESPPFPSPAILRRLTVILSLSNLQAE